MKLIFQGWRVGKNDALVTGYNVQRPVPIAEAVTQGFVTEFRRVPEHRANELKLALNVKKLVPQYVRMP